MSHSLPPTPLSLQGLTPCRVPVESFHLTVGVLKLFEDKEVKQAKEALATAAERARGHLALLPANQQPPQIHVKGLAVMQSNPRQSHVLYAKACLMGEEDAPLEQSTLQRAMDSIRAVFVEAGLMQHEEHVKIHATLLNSRHGARWRCSTTTRPLLARTGLFAHTPCFSPAHSQHKAADKF